MNVDSFQLLNNAPCNHIKIQSFLPQPNHNAKQCNFPSGRYFLDLAMHPSYAKHKKCLGHDIHRRNSISYCTLKNSSSPLLVGVNLGIQPGVRGNSVRSSSVPPFPSVYSSVLPFPTSPLLPEFTFASPNVNPPPPSSAPPEPNIGLQPGLFARSLSPSFKTLHPLLSCRLFLSS